MKLGKFFFLLMTVCVGLVIVYTFLGFEPFLSQGDHGRDLYCIKKVYDGQQPYRDFWWEYGPAMLYYYAFMFKTLGVSIQSVILGKQLVVFLAGIFMYLAAVELMAPVMAFVVAVFFFVFRPDFFYTFNHIGGMLMMVVVMVCLFSFFRTRKDIYVYGGLAAILLLNFIRLNLGFSSLAAFFLSLYFFARSYNLILPWRSYTIAAVAMMVLTGAVYVSLVAGLPIEGIKKCFPYLPSYHSDKVSSLQMLGSLIKIIWFNFTYSIPRRLFGLLLLLMGGRIYYRWHKNELDKKLVSTVLGSTALFTVFSAHEYFFSEYVFRLFWAFPAVVLFFFAIIYFACEGFSNQVRRIIFAVLIGVMGFCLVDLVGTVFYYKKPLNLFEYGPNKVYIANAEWGEDRHDKVYPNIDHWGPVKWSQTVIATTNYLKAHLNSNETFLALPYDSMYYFLTDRDSPVYPLAFFTYINISPQEEYFIISQLERKKIRYVLLSNRSISQEKHLGNFGKDYCPVLAQYLADNFKVVQTYGNWNAPANFAINHAVRILERK